MNRKETTQFLSHLLEHTSLSGAGTYYAKEVSIAPYTDEGIAKRIDYMLFVPENQLSVAGIEKGIFTCYEIKSCKEDVYSGNGLNFLGEKNYIVTTMECWKSITSDYREGKLDEHIRKCNPESSEHYGIMVAVPYGRELTNEFEHPTPLDEKRSWTIEIVIPCRQGQRKKSMTELLFCMLRSGQ